jgi:hypothetical protein
LEAVDRALPAVRGAVVDDHEHPLRIAVGLDGHELLDELVQRDDPVGGGAAVEQLGALDVPGGEVAERALAVVLVLDSLPAPDAGRGGQRGGLRARAWIEGFSSRQTT